MFVGYFGGPSLASIIGNSQDDCPILTLQNILGQSWNEPHTSLLELRGGQLSWVSPGLCLLSVQTA